MVFSISSLSQGTLNNSGTITLKGNLENQNGSQSNLGTGTFEFLGTSAQTITGQNLMTNVIVNNAAGLIIGGNTQVNGILTLTSGLVTLGANNLVMGPSASIAGTPSATKMVVATSTGEMQKQFTANGSFLFPVGDNTSTAEYSPVTLNFTSGTYPSNNYIGVSLKNQAYNTGIYTGSYLNRYWVVTNTSGAPIISFTCDATFNYLTADISGSESQLYCTKVAPDPVVTYAAANTGAHSLTASGLTSFSTFTGTKGGLFASFTAFLEGPYISGAMNTGLNTLGLIPLTQPYSGSPWNYSDAVPVGTIPAGAVDWVLIDLRQAASPDLATSGTSVAKKAVFLKSDGTIVDKDGSSAVKFYNVAITNNLYPVIYHSNHIAIMANNAVTRTNGIYTYDFSTALSQVYGGGVGYKQIPGTSPALYGMVAGDIDHDGSVWVSDYNIWAANQGASGDYYNADLDFDGNIWVSDYNKWAANQGTSNPLLMANRPKFVTAVP